MVCQIEVREAIEQLVTTSLQHRPTVSPWFQELNSKNQHTRNKSKQPQVAFRTSI